MSDQMHFGPTAPTSLNAVNNAMITPPRVRKVTIQAALFTSPSAVLHWRVAYATSLPATALNTAEGFLIHGGAAELELNPTAQAYIYVFVTDANGTALAGGAGALDRVDVWATN